MNSDKILVDTSIWIEYFKNNDKYVNFIENAFDTMSVFIAGPVLCELLQGVNSSKEFQKLSSCIDAIPFINIDKDDWIKAGEISNTLRKQGVTIPLADIILGSTCLNHNLKILTLDKHFKSIPGVKLVQLPI